MVSRYAHLAPVNLKGATDCLSAGQGWYKDGTNATPTTPHPGKLLKANGSR